MGSRRATGTKKTEEAARSTPAEARRRSAQSDIAELLHRAWEYDDKPHQLYSHIMAMADRHEPDLAVRAEIRRLMDRQYLRAGSGTACLKMDAARRDPAKSPFLASDHPRARISRLASPSETRRERRPHARTRRRRRR